MKTITRRIRLHACPRCRGDLFPDEDGLTCLQCGRNVALDEVGLESERPPAPAEKKEAASAAA